MKREFWDSCTTQLKITILGYESPWPGRNTLEDESARTRPTSPTLGAHVKRAPLLKAHRRVYEKAAIHTGTRHDYVGWLNRSILGLHSIAKGVSSLWVTFFLVGSTFCSFVFSTTITAKSLGLKRSVWHELRTRYSYTLAT